MGKKSNDAPPSPDYTGLAQQQAALSAQNTQQQTQANRPNVYTPWGSQTWTQDPKDPNSWTTNISLSPQQQQALDAQMSVQNTRQQGAQSLANQVVQNYQNPMDFSGAPAQSQNMTGGPQLQGGQGIQGQMQNTAGDWRQKAQSSVEQLQQPGLDRQRAALDTQLANQGITRGSDAYNAAMQEQADNEARANLMAIQAGQQEANMLFNQDLQGSQFANQAQQQGFSQNALAQNQNFNNQLQANQFNNQNRQQALSEMYQQRAQPLNELNALQTGQQVTSPQMPSYTNAQRSDTANLLTAANMGYQANLDASNASNASQSGLMGGLFSLGGAALSNPSLFNFSDARLKRDIKPLFKLPNGIQVYSYRMIGKEHHEMGVLAQEVAMVMPSAVAVDPESGFMKVNYDRVLGY